MSLSNDSLDIPCASLIVLIIISCFLRCLEIVLGEHTNSSLKWRAPFFKVTYWLYNHCLSLSLSNNSLDMPCASLIVLIEIPFFLRYILIVLCEHTNSSANWYVFFLWTIYWSYNQSLSFNLLYTSIYIPWASILFLISILY